MKLCINSRDELRVIELDEVVYLKACGNYTDFHFLDGQVKSEIAGLSVFSSLIEGVYDSASSPFVRAGRSYIINLDYVSVINVPKQTVQFKNSIFKAVSLPKNQCMDLKALMFSRLKPTSSSER